MSLINEALQRAREEVVRQEAAKKGLPLAPAQRFKEKSSWLTAAVLILAVALAISVVALLGLSRQIPATATTADVGASVATTPPDRSTMSAVVAETPTDLSVDRSLQNEITPSEDPGSIEVNPEVTKPDDLERPKPSETPRTIELRATPPKEAAAEPAPEPSQALETPDPSLTEPVAEVRVETYLRHAELADDASIELGGIAWSESGPYALLNGRVVGIGESVSGLIVRQIDPLEVVLEGRGRKISLRLK